MSEDEGGREFLIREWDQAWTQSRHLETMRSQYLGFFLTIVVGVVAVAGQGLADERLTSARLAATAALALVLQFLSMILFLAIRRMNQVLDHYTDRIFALTAEIKAGSDISDANRASVRPDIPTWLPRGRRVASTSGSSQAVPAVGVGLFAVVVGASAVRALTTTSTRLSVDLLLVAAALLSVGLVWTCRPRESGEGPTAR